MKRSMSIIAVAAVLAGLIAAQPADAVELRPNCWTQMGSAWYPTYSDATWGAPVALVVPPTARYKFDYGWGVGNSRMSAITSQFGLNYVAPTGTPGSFNTLPRWPSDTTQFGIYYVRGPW